MQREVTPELLDQLPPEDSRAIGSRRDLQKVNGWMRHTRIMAEVLRSAFAERPPQTLVELGAGDGRQMLSVAKLLAPDWKNVSATLVDKQRLLNDETQAEFANLGWRVEAAQADVFEWLDRPRAKKSDVCIANLFLHHFQGDSLRRLLGRASEQADFFSACEPERGFVLMGAARLLWFIGCNDVTRHDARVSVQAGFTGKELSALWPREEGWRLMEHKAGLLSHCFVAQRNGGK